MPSRRHRTRSRRQTSGGRLRAGGLIAALVIVLIVIALAVVNRQIKGYFIGPRGGGRVAVAPQSPEMPPTEAPLFVPSPAASPTALSTGPKVAIIIDDCGYNVKRCEQFLALPIPLTIAILPLTPHGKELDKDARAAGKSVMLHLPMEADSPLERAGPGAIMTAMSDDQVQNQVVADIDFLPDISGANNHMGSKASSDPRIMRDVLEVLHKRHMFFIDSMTSMSTVGATTARELGIPTAERDVFLDNLKDLKYIEGQFKVLEEVALRRGSAIAIGHPFDTTAQALTEAIPQMEAAGITFVSAQSLVK